jgi:hypothetical protein
MADKNMRDYVIIVRPVRVEIISLEKAKYYKYVGTLVLANQHANDMRLILFGYCHLWPVWLTIFFFKLSHEGHNFCK